MTSKHATAGDAAVDGLIYGFGADVVLAGYLMMSGLVMGEGPEHVSLWLQAPNRTNARGRAATGIER